MLLASARLPDKGTIFAAEATAITPALDYHRHMDPIQRDDDVYSDLMPYLQVISSENV